MAFLDNSGDIILDAVLTDTGRLRLAQGDGSFKISKFALGDDEINYGLYNKDHSSGSAYYDLEILQTPVLEAFTNNTSNLKTKLISVSRTNILYMPILKLNLNNVDSTEAQNHSSMTYSRNNKSMGTTQISDSKFYIAVDSDTDNFLKNAFDDASDISEPLQGGRLLGLIQGYNADAAEGHIIRVDQGLDTSEISPNSGLDSDLLETAFIAEMDYRLGRIKPWNSHTPTAVNFIDDDNVASYYLTSNAYINPFDLLGKPKSTPSKAEAPGTLSKKKSDLLTINPQAFEGPRGNTLHFRIQASQELQSSTYLFTQLGNSQLASTTDNILGLDTTTLAGNIASSSKTIYYIDSTVRISGANTGYRLDIPVRYVKIV